MSRFSEIEFEYSIQCYDYMSGKTYVYSDNFSSYEKAHEAIKSVVPPSPACGFQIIQLPKLNVSCDFNFPVEVENAKPKK